MNDRFVQVDRLLFSLRRLANLKRTLRRRTDRWRIPAAFIQEIGDESVRAAVAEIAQQIELSARRLTDPTATYIDMRHSCHALVNGCDGLSLIAERRGHRRLEKAAQELAGQVDRVSEWVFDFEFAA